MKWFEMLVKDPLAAHEYVCQREDGFSKLAGWVKNLAIEHKVCLTVKPTAFWAVEGWKKLGGILLLGTRESVEHTSSAEFEGLSDDEVRYVRSHVRSAYTRIVRGEEHFWSGSLVNWENPPAWVVKLLVAYNKAAKESWVLGEGILPIQEYGKFKSLCGPFADLEVE